MSSLPLYVSKSIFRPQVSRISAKFCDKKPAIFFSLPAFLRAAVLSAFPQSLAKKESLEFLSLVFKRAGHAGGREVGRPFSNSLTQPCKDESGSKSSEFDREYSKLCLLTSLSTHWQLCKEIIVFKTNLRPRPPCNCSDTLSVAMAANMDPGMQHFIQRETEKQKLQVRKTKIFFTKNWQNPPFGSSIIR